jgi:hypothetical protein
VECIEGGSGMWITSLNSHSTVIYSSTKCREHKKAEPKLGSGVLKVNSEI